MSEILFNFGIVITFVIFAVNAGILLSSEIFTAGSETETINKIYIFLKYSFGVFILFLMTYHLFNVLNIEIYIKNYLQNSIIFIQLILASGLFFNGLNIYTENKKSSKLNRAFSKIIMGLSFLFLIILIINLIKKAYVISVFSSTLTAYMIFTAISTLTFIGIFIAKKKKLSVNASFSGLLMIIVAIYFFAALSVIPVYDEFSKIYSLSSQNISSKTSESNQIIILYTAAFLIFVIGYIFTRQKLFIIKMINRKNRRNKNNV